MSLYAAAAVNSSLKLVVKEGPSHRSIKLWWFTLPVLLPAFLTPLCLVRASTTVYRPGENSCRGMAALVQCGKIYYEVDYSATIGGKYVAPQLHYYTDLKHQTAESSK
jgi:hypothetical protein